jgi:hypothetical protein
MMSDNRESRLRKVLLNVHLYSGLFCCPYLVIFGFTSLAFNHPWLMPKGESPPMEWERKIEVAAGSENNKLAEAVRDQLGLFGWVPRWAIKRASEKVLKFELSRPGKRYLIEWNQENGLAQVAEYRTGLASVLHFMHGSNGTIPNSRFTRLWGFYTDVTTWFVLFALGSGVYLWTNRERERRVGWIIFGASQAGSLGMMAYVYLIG